MKIGILTQPLRRNYGGILQNWALQQVLLGMGHEPETIFICMGHRPKGILLVMRCMSLVKCVVRKFLFGHKNVYLYSVFNPQYSPKCPQYADAEFVRYIRKTKQLIVDMDIAKYIRKRGYDSFVVGSDQVWREEYSPLITHYFLDFLLEDDKRPRIAYAASFGKAKNYISEKYMPYCQKLLHQFDAVSVREYEGLEILQKDFGYEDGVKVLDPTLLISADQYRGLIKNVDYVCERKPHIAAYILDSHESSNDILANLSSRLGIPFKIFSAEPQGQKMLTISQWLAEFDSSDFIFTDSFHGCVFSILFHRPFVAIVNIDRGRDRIVSLLHDCGLESHIVFSFEDFKQRVEKLMLPIDYIQVEKLLKKKRADSFQFLYNAINNETA